MPDPTVTVAALCYNHERFVAECLDSIQAQTFQDFELIIVDDASADDSSAIIRDWIAKHRPQTRYIANAANRGVCAVLNATLEVARGRYFAQTSTDDVWIADKLERQVAVLSHAAPDVGMVYSDATLMDVNGDPLPGRFIATHLPGLEPPSGQLLDALTRKNFIPAMSTLIRTDVLRAVGGYDETLAFEDYDMWLRIARRYRIIFLPGEGARYRVVPGSLGDELFRSRKRRVALSSCRIVSKQLRRADLAPEHRAVWLARLGELAYELFVAEAPEAPLVLRELARHSPKPRWILLAAAATVGIKRSHLGRIRQLLHRSPP